MQKVIMAWCAGDDHDFESKVPLKFVGQRYAKLGFLNNFQVLFLEGFARLSDEYKHELKALGYVLHDASRLYQAYADRYRALDRFGDYEKKCFLRWMVLKDLFAGQQLLHVDGDLVFNEDPQLVGELVEGKTFVLQGCPAFTVISDRQWYDQYRQALDQFVSDIDAYSMMAWQQRDDWQITYTTRWAGSRFRHTITSDQDLISHLIHTKQLIQTPIEEVMLSLKDYFYFENPLFLHMFDNNFPYRYQRERGIDYFLGVRVDGQNVPFKKKILFWHMQSCFSFYAGKFMRRQSFFKWLPAGRLKLHLSTPGTEDKLNKMLHPPTRLDVYRYFFEAHDFSGIFSPRTWWKEGIFEK